MYPTAVVLIAVTCLVATTLWAADRPVIVNSGSTNTAGFRIAVEQSGKASYTQMPHRSGLPSDAQGGSKSRNLPKDLVQRFYADLEAAKPFSDLPSGGCMKSASFGTALTIEFAGQKTPDLSCGDHDNAKLKALIADANEIVKAFN